MTIDYYYQVCLIYMHIKYYYNNKIYNPSLILLVPPSLAFLFNVTLSLQFIIL